MVGYYVSDCGCKNNEFVKLKKGGYKTPAQLEKEGYKVVQFHGIIPGREVQHTGYIFIRGKEVTIAYRGTCNSYDFKIDVEIPLIRQYELLPKGGEIHLGFYSVFENSWESLYGILKGYANDQGLEIRDLKINLTGHSMGGAVANIAALCLSVTENVKNLHVATFGAPRVFDCDAAKVCNELFGRKTIRVANLSDAIPAVPFGFMHYKHVGKQLKIGRYSVPALHDHKLEVYHDLVLKIKPKNFKSDNNTSATCYILSRAAREVYDVLTVPSCLIPSTHSSSDKQYFKQVKDQHKNASFSEIINRYSELSNRNDKFLDKDRRN
ncbi:MAG: lipase family protein, partial [Wolbachia sp.]